MRVRGVLGVLTLAWLLAASPVHAEAGNPRSGTDQSPGLQDAQGVLLASSASIKSSVDATVRMRVHRILAGGLDGQNQPVHLTAEQVLSFLGTADVRNRDRQAAGVEVFAPRDLKEDPQEVVPFGLAGIGRAVMHPTRALRLFTPVSAAPRSIDIAHANLGPIRVCHVPCQ